MYDLYEDKMKGFLFKSAEGFQRAYPLGEREHQGLICEQGRYEVRFATLDHRIPSLAFSVIRRPYARICKETLEEKGYPKGAWLSRLLAFAEGKGEEESLSWKGQSISFSQIAQELVRFEPQEKIGYVVDTIYSPEVETKVVQLVQGADLFFCEASFLRQDLKKARKTYHLCGFQAGIMARKAKVKKFIPFHFSWSYSGEVGALIQEAMDAFSSGTEK